MIIKTKLTSIATILLFSVFSTNFSFTQNLLPYSENGKYGFSDVNGNIIIKCEYEDVEPFKSKEFARAKKNNTWGVLDTLGRFVPNVYSGDKHLIVRKVIFLTENSTKYRHSDHLFQVTVHHEKKWGILSFNNRTFSGFKYLPAGYFEKNKRNNIPSYLRNISFNHGLSVVQKGEIEVNIIDSTGTEVLKENHEGIRILTSDRLVLYKNELAALAKANGELLTPFEYFNIYGYGKGRFVVSKHNRKTSEKWNFNTSNPAGIERRTGVLDYNGNIIIDTIYSSFLKIDSLGYKVSKRGLYGILDFNGNELLPIKYNWLFKTDNNEFNATLETCKGVINSKGDTLVPFLYDRLVYNKTQKIFSFFDGSNYGLINNDKEIIFTIQKGWIRHLAYDSTKYTFSANQKTGLLNKNGTILIPAIYNNITNFDDDYYWAALAEGNCDLISKKNRKSYLVSKW